MEQTASGLKTETPIFLARDREAARQAQAGFFPPCVCCFPLSYLPFDIYVCVLVFHRDVLTFSANTVKVDAVGKARGGTAAAAAAAAAADDDDDSSSVSSPHLTPLLATTLSKETNEKKM